MPPSYDEAAKARRLLEEELISLGAVRINNRRLSFKRDSESMIGEGGYGTVYIGSLRNETGPGSARVAVKQLRSDAAHDLRVAIRLVREIKAWRQLFHANILPLLGFHLSDNLDVAIVVSPYMPLGDVSHYLNNNPEVDFMKRLDLCLDALNGLNYLHEQGYCHGDIKPANMLVNSKTKAMLTDFGLLKATANPALRTLNNPLLKSTTGGIKGSWRYISPEVFDGQPRSTCSDVWALGCTVLENNNLTMRQFNQITTGSHPYPFATSDSSIISSILAKKETPEQGMTLPDTVDLWVLLRGCWKFEAADRATAAQCIANYYFMLATLYTQGGPEASTASPVHDRGQYPWKEILGQLIDTEPKEIADTLHIGRWKEAANVALQHSEGTKANPAQSLPKLAISLQVLAHDISDLGRDREGLVLQREACKIFRALVSQGQPEYQSQLIDGLCRTCTIATKLELKDDAFTAITDAIDLRCKESYAFQTIDALKDCFVQLDVCVTILKIYDRGSVYLKDKVVALRASVRGLSSDSNKTPRKSHRSVKAIRDSVSGGHKGSKLQKARSFSLTKAGSVSLSRSDPTGSTIAWDTSSIAGRSVRTGGVLSRQTTGTSIVSTNSPVAAAAPNHLYTSTINLNGEYPETLSGGNSILDFVRVIAFCLHLQATYLRKESKSEEAAATLNEASRVYMKISGHSRSTPPGVDIASALYEIACNLHDMQQLDRSKTAVEEATRIYTFYVQAHPEYTESMDQCLELLEEVKAQIKLRDRGSKGFLWSKNSSSAVKGEDQKITNGKKGMESLFGVDVNLLDSVPSKRELVERKTVVRPEALALAPMLEEWEGNPFGRYPDAQNNFPRDLHEPSWSREVRGRNRTHQERRGGRLERSSASQPERPTEAPVTRNRKFSEDNVQREGRPSRAGPARLTSGWERDKERPVNGRKPSAYERREEGTWDERQAGRTDLTPFGQTEVPPPRALSVLPWKSPPPSDALFNPWSHASDPAPPDTWSTHEGTANATNSTTSKSHSLMSSRHDAQVRTHPSSHRDELYDAKFVQLKPRSSRMRSDAEPEMERDNRSKWGGKDSAFAFSTRPQSEALLALDRMKPVPAQSALGMDGLGPAVADGDVQEKKMVYLEMLELPQTSPPELRGSILVRNLAAEKLVTVRFTFDYWETAEQVLSTFSESLESLPPPFCSSEPPTPQIPAPSDRSTVPGGFPIAPLAPVPNSWDRFSFTIKLEDEHSIAKKKLFLVVKYILPSQPGWEDVMEWWDNNDGKEYAVSFKLERPIVPTGLEGAMRRISPASTPSPPLRPTRVDVSKEHPVLPETHDHRPSFNPAKRNEPEDDLFKTPDMDPQGVDYDSGPTNARIDQTTAARSSMDAEEIESTTQPRDSLINGGWIDETSGTGTYKRRQSDHSNSVSATSRHITSSEKELPALPEIDEQDIPVLKVEGRRRGIKSWFVGDARPSHEAMPTNNLKKGFLARF
ncbi:hypothetical protein FRB97_008071 [Tulasnella sp. 331]|nr:hypothetical protein FRB97_008071 [Tulasnella sp. 331]KAG8877098.1 hypothetical protein FRB98_006910 [Tulasnella sp. 332]